MQVLGLRVDNICQFVGGGGGKGGHKVYMFAHVCYLGSVPGPCHFFSRTYE